MIQAQESPPEQPATATRAFLRHYAEMVLAMAVGMPIFGVLFVSPLDPLGYRATLQAHPYMRELLMLVAMTIPMVGFMAYRRHPWPRTIEMVAGMALPALAVIGLTASSLIPIFTVGTLIIFSHLAMLLGMLAAMLYRRAEYSGTHHHHVHLGQGGTAL